MGTRWNAVEFVTFNTTWDVESLINVDFFVELKTSIPNHENYGTRLKFNLDLAEYPSASTVVTVIFPSNRVNHLPSHHFNGNFSERILGMQIGFGVNGSMTETEDGPTIDVTVTLDIADYPNMKIEISHETKGQLDFKTTAILSRGEHSINVNAYATTAVKLFPTNFYPIRRL